MKISQVGQGIESSVDNYLSLLKRVAKVLIAVGLVDIAYMVYCIANGQGYSSSLNIFAVIAGIFLWRGHLGAVRIVTRFSALMLTAATGIVLFLLPTLQPAGLWLLEFKLNPVRTISGLIIMVAMLLLLAWVYQQLRTRSVVQALCRAGQPTASPRFAFGIGAAIPVLVAIMFHCTLSSGAGLKAIELARTKYGNQYQYSPNSINWSGSHVSARLTAYNDHEMKAVAVEWSN
jgi:hypothetical protein